MTSPRLAATMLAAAVTALPAAAFSKPSDETVRLSAPVAPTSERVLLRVDPDADRYTGEVTVAVRVETATRSFRLHAEEMEISAVKLTGPGGEIAVEHAPDDWATVRVTAAEPLPAGDYTLEIAFSNDYGTHAVGLYKMEHEGHGYAFTQFESIDAREAFPCWDEPGYKIPWQIVLEVPDKQEAYSNTSIEKEEPAGDGWKRLTFRRTPPLPSYLVAIGVGPLETVPIPGMGVPGRVITVAGQSKLAGLAAETTAPILAALERWFGEPYPYEKLDLIAIPEYWPGAMEHPGAITYASNILLVDPKAVTPGQKALLVRISAHEMAHMWFGDLVTMKWWDDLWLNETFADWMGDKIAHEVHPEFKRDLAEVQDGLDAMIGDARPSAQAIRQPVVHADLMDNVGAQYNKGKTVLGMFESWIGPEVFRTGVRAYLAAHRWGNAEAGDLWKALDEASGRDVSGALATFIEQPGLPLVAVAPGADGRVRLTQRRFATAGVEMPDETWSIPVGLRWKDAAGVHQRTVLLDQPSQEVDLAGAPVWVMPDADKRGYYRWSVPAAMLKTLSADATASLSERERVGFVGNLRALLDSGLVDGGAYLDTLAAFANDPQPMVVSGVLDALDGVRLPFVAEGLEKPFAAYVRRALNPALERFGAEPRPGEAPDVALVRPRLLRVLGVEGEDEAVLSRAAENARRYMADPASVDPSIAGVSLLLAARRGDRALFDAYRKAAEAATVPAVRDRFLNSLGAFEDPALRSAALDYALAGKLRPNELFAIPGTMANGRYIDEVFSWVLEHYDAFAQRLPAEYLPYLSGFGGGCSAERLARTREFFGAGERTGPGTGTQLARVTDQVTSCLALRKREGGAAAAYLQAGAP